MKIVMRVQGDSLVPDHPSGIEDLRTYNQGQTVVADVKGARNPRHHNLYWLLMELIADNHPEIHHKDAAHRECKVALEMYDWHIDRTGTATREFRSIAFESMDQSDFTVLFRKAVDWACDELGSEPDEVIAALHALTGDKRYTDMLERVRKIGGR